MRVWGSILTGVVVLAGGAVLSSGCQHDDSVLFVRSVLAPQIVDPGTACNFTSDPTQPYITGGTNDIALTPYEYVAHMLVGNQLVPQGNPNTPRTETSFVRIQRAVVRVMFGGQQISTFTTESSTTIPPSVGTSPSYGVVDVALLDPASIAYVTPLLGSSEVTLVTYTKVMGVTLGGQSVETGEFEFPVNVCSGCLIICGSPTSNATQITTGSCDHEDFFSHFAPGDPICGGSTTQTTDAGGTQADAAGTANDAGTLAD